MSFNKIEILRYFISPSMIVAISIHVFCICSVKGFFKNLFVNYIENLDTTFCGRTSVRMYVGAYVFPYVLPSLPQSLLPSPSQLPTFLSFSPPSLVSPPSLPPFPSPPFLPPSLPLSFVPSLFVESVISCGKTFPGIKRLRG